MLKIKRTIRQDSGQTDLDDILKIKKALAKTGHYEAPEYGLTPYPDKKLFGAIKKFQKDNKLKIDGVINPDGETINALKDTLPDDLPSKSPIMRCPKCGAPHGGSKGSLCPDCDAKS